MMPMPTVEQNELRRSPDNSAVATTTEASTSQANDVVTTTKAAAQPTNNCEPSTTVTDGSRVPVSRPSRTTSLFSNELPIRQFVADSRSSPKPGPSRTSTAAKRKPKTTASNPAAVFSEAGPPSCSRSSLVVSVRRATTASKPIARIGASGPSSTSTGLGTTTCQWSPCPWRSRAAQRSDNEVRRNLLRERTPSVSADVRGRASDKARVTPSTRIRRTLSVPAAASRPSYSDSKDSVDPSPASPASVSEQCSYGRGRSPTTSETTTKPLRRSRSRLPRLIASEKPSQETAVAATESVRDDVWRIEIPIPGVRSVLVWSAVLALVAGYTFLHYYYMNNSVLTPVPPRRQ